MIDVKEIAKCYGENDFSIIKEIDSSRGDEDKRYTYLIKFDDGLELAIKVCQNDFTTPERILGWQKTCEHYLNLGIYCPQIVKNRNGGYSENIIFGDENYIVYAEEMKKYKTQEEFEGDVAPDIPVRDSVRESVGLVASSGQELVPWHSAYCVFVKFSEYELTDENYETAEIFCNTVRENYPQYNEYVDRIWDMYIAKRTQFEPIYHKLPKAVFQGDLNPTNVLVDDEGKFAGLIDFNLSGTETVLCYILLPEVCLYNLQCEDLEYLTDEDFLKKCDDFLYDNLRKINKHYKFSDYERENFNLCYNAIVPFCFYMTVGLLKWVIREKKDERVDKILDWVYYQLSRDDMRLEL